MDLGVVENMRFQQLMRSNFRTIFSFRINAGGIIGLTASESTNIWNLFILIHIAKWK